MIPTSIDGTDITGATIDGTDVTEITVDGDTVFSAGPENFPVAYSNLVAWYPFDSATYGGANADDVTAILGGSGDDTAYNGTSVNSPTISTSGGAKDINAGDGSSFVEFDSLDAYDMEDSTLTSFPDTGSPFSYVCWVKWDSLFDNRYKYMMGGAGGARLYYPRSGLDAGVGFYLNNNGTGEAYTTGSNSLFSNNEWYHVVGTYDGSSAKIYIDAVDEGSFLFNPGVGTGTDFYIGQYDNDAAEDSSPNIDDVRVYNIALSQTQVTSIFNNTKPSSKP